MDADKPPSSTPSTVAPPTTPLAQPVTPLAQVAQPLAYADTLTNAQDHRRWKRDVNRWGMKVVWASTGLGAALPWMFFRERFGELPWILSLPIWFFGGIAGFLLGLLGLVVGGGVAGLNVLGGINGHDPAPKPERESRRL